MALEVKPEDIQKAKFIFSTFDFEGKDAVDSYHLGDCLRALDFTPSLKTIGKLGGCSKKGERTFTIEEFLTAIGEAKKDNDIGCLPGYIEVLKCYDKYEDGNLPVNLLHSILSTSGERMDTDTIQMVIDDVCGDPDDEGNIKYVDFITKICNGPTSPFDDFDFLGTKSEKPISKPSKPGPKAVVIAEPEVEADTDTSVSVKISAPKKGRPSITVADEDTPSVSYAEAKPLIMPRVTVESEEEEPQAATFTLKAPKKS